MCITTASRQRSLRVRLAALLCQGCDPATLALTLALGLVIGVMPLPFGASLLCALLAGACGCNQALIQLANYAVWPLQVLLFIPFLRLGQFLFGAGDPPLDFATIGSGLQQDAFATLQGLGLAGMKGFGAWGVLSPLLVIGLQQLFGRMLRRRAAQEGERQGPV